MKLRTRVALGTVLSAVLVLAPVSTAEAETTEECDGIIDLVLGCIVGGILDPVIPDPTPTPDPEPQPEPSPAPEPAPTSPPAPAPSPTPARPAPAPSATPKPSQSATAPSSPVVEETYPPTQAPQRIVRTWNPVKAEWEDIPIPVPSITPQPAATSGPYTLDMSQAQPIEATAWIGPTPDPEKLHPFWLWSGVIGVLVLTSISLSCAYVYVEGRRTH